MVAKWVAEAEARLHNATQSFSSLIGAWRGCGNTSTALCCLPSMSSFSRGTLQLIAILAQTAVSRPGVVVPKWVAGAEARLNIANQSFSSLIGV